MRRAASVRHARRRIGLMAPAMFCIAVPVAALAVTNTAWSSWVMAVLSVAAVAGGTWWALEGAPGWMRASASAAAVLVSAATLYLGILVLWPAMTSADGLVSNWAIYGYLLLPWLPLLAGGAAATIAGRTADSGPAWPWWAAGLVACAAAYPLIGFVTNLVKADDMAMLIVIFIPAYALGLWLGPLLAVLVAGLPRSATSPEEVTAP